MPKPFLHLGDIRLTVNRRATVTPAVNLGRRLIHRIAFLLAEIIPRMVEPTEQSQRSATETAGANLEEDCSANCRGVPAGVESRDWESWVRRSLIVNDITYVHIIDQLPEGRRTHLQCALPS